MSIAVSNRNIFFRRSSAARNFKNWNLHLEQKNKFFPNFYKIAHWSTQDYKKIFIFAKMVSI